MSPVPGAPAVEVRGLTVDRGHVRALEDVSLEVATGSVTVLLGPNGSGKSTLQLAILGMVTPTAGRIRLLGRPVREALRAGMVAAVPQADEIDARFPVTVREVALQGRRPFTGPLRRPGPADRDAAEAALDRVGLAHLADRRIGDLSGGQRRRALLARCLAQEAELLVLDEPFTGVDARSEAVFVDVLRELAAQGRSAFVSTHSLGSLDALADHAVLLDRTVVAAGPAAETLTPASLVRLLGVRP